MADSLLGDGSGECSAQGVVLGVAEGEQIGVSVGGAFDEYGSGVAPMDLRHDLDGVVHGGADRVVEAFPGPTFDLGEQGLLTGR